MWLKIVAIAWLVFIVNVPCGYWREGTRKFSPAWFAAVHIAIPMVAYLRHVTGIGYVWYTFPIFIAVYLGGQFLGSRLRRRRKSGVE